MNYQGPLYLPRTSSCFELKSDFVTELYLRGKTYSRVPHTTNVDMSKYGVKKVGKADLWLIPSGNKFTLYVKQNTYHLEFTKKLNPHDGGAYNIIVGDWRANIEISLVEFIR
jgi:hypothetical protein